MRKKSVLMIMILTIVLLCVGCGFNNGEGGKTTIEVIIVTDGTMDMEEVSQETEMALKSADQGVTVDNVKLSEENKYVVTVSTNLTEDEVVSELKEEDWVQRAEINYELKMY